MNSQSPQEICQVCKLPKTHEGSASLTQWILICSCNQKIDPDIQQKTQNICQKCGKRSIQDRKGSFTQWILRSDLCDCEVPKILKPSSPIEQTQELEPAGTITQELEPDEDLNVAGFPVERFKPIRELGKGASSSVYLSLDKLLNKYVAIKCLYNLTPELTVQFQNEAKLSTKMNHPSIGSVMDVGVSNDSTPYMVLEYFEGISLDNYLESYHPLSEEIVFTIFEQILNGVAYAHSKGILHKDIKPANILVSQNEEGELQAKIIDFGSSTFEPTQGDSNSNSFCGTPSYMAPDEPQGYSYTEQSEVYSIGCVLFELLTGSQPFQGESAVEILRKHVDSVIPQVDTRDDLEHLDHFNKIIGKCLQKNAANRYKSVQELLGELSKFESLKEDLSQASKPKDSSSTTKQKITVGTICGFAALTLLYLGYNKFTITSNTSSKTETKKTIDSKTSSKKQEGRETKVSNSIDFLKPTLSKKSLFTRATNKYLVPVDPFALKDEDLKFLPRKTQLLNLVGCPINGSGFKPFKRRGIRLRHLNLNGTLVEDENLKYLRGMKSLTWLSFGATSITNQGLKNLGKLNIKNLYLSDDKEIDDDTVDVIVKQFPKVQKMSIGEDKFTDKGLAKLKQLKNLKKLSIRRIKLTDKTMSLILKIPVKTLVIFNSNLKDEDILNFRNSTFTRELVLENCSAVTAKGIKRLRKLRPDIKVSRSNYVDKTDPKYWKQVIDF